MAYKNLSKKQNKKVSKLYKKADKKYDKELVEKGNKLTEKANDIRYKAGKKADGASAKFPEIKKKNEGKFTAWVEKNMGGMDTCKAASKVMKSRTKKYSPAVVKMANYANNFSCKTKKEGASMDHGKKGASFNPKLKKAVADGKIKGKFADTIMKG
jgi:hypothetical protein